MPWILRQNGDHRCNTRDPVADLYAGRAGQGDQWCCEECGLTWMVMKHIPTNYEVICIDRPHNRYYLVNTQVKNASITEGMTNE